MDKKSLYQHSSDIHCMDCNKISQTVLMLWKISNVSIYVLPICKFYLSEASKELNLEFNNKPYNFIDVETGKNIKINPFQYKHEYRKKIDLYHEKLRLKCLQYKIDLIEVDINKGYDQIISSYLLKRQKMFWGL